MNKELTEQAITAELFKQMNNNLNEAFESSLVRDFLMKSQQVAKERKTDMQIAFLWRGKLMRMYILGENGKLYRRLQHSSGKRQERQHLSEADSRMARTRQDTEDRQAQYGTSCLYNSEETCCCTRAD